MIGNPNIQQIRSDTILYKHLISKSVTLQFWFAVSQPLGIFCFRSLLCHYIPKIILELSLVWCWTMWDGSVLKHVALMLHVCILRCYDVGEICPQWVRPTFQSTKSHICGCSCYSRCLKDHILPRKHTNIHTHTQWLTRWKSASLLVLLIIKGSTLVNLTVPQIMCAVTLYRIYLWNDF